MIPRIPAPIFYFAIPCLIIIFLLIAERLLANLYAEWIMVPITALYWCGLWCGLLFLKYRIGIDYQSWWILRKGQILWKVISMVSALLVIPWLFYYNDIPNYLTDQWIFIGIIFAIINTLLEESFWRGFMVTYPVQSSVGIKIVFSALLFTLTKVVLWDINPDFGGWIALLGIIFLTSILWGITAHSNKSIIWTFLAHLFMILLGAAWHLL